MCIDVLFVVCIALICSERVLTRIAGKTIASALIFLSACGLCSLMALFFVEAL
jgi:hypothetical protein